MRGWPHLGSLEQQATASHDIPRFDDRMVNIRELIRIMDESLVHEIMDAQAEDACGEGGQRNGYRERNLVASAGVIRLRIPKLRRGSFFPEDLPVRYSRADGAVIAAVPEMVASGVSTRKAERAAARMGIDRMGSSRASRSRETPEVVTPTSGTLPPLWLPCSAEAAREPHPKATGDIRDQGDCSLREAYADGPGARFTTCWAPLSLQRRRLPRSSRR